MDLAERGCTPPLAKATSSPPYIPPHPSNVLSPSPTRPKSSKA
jgi:hypothetical protein